MGEKSKLGTVTLGGNADNKKCQDNEGHYIFCFRARQIAFKAVPFKEWLGLVIYAKT